MADYHGTARSNYVRWNMEKLNALKCIFEITTVKNGDTGFHAIHSDSDWGTPSPMLWDYDPEDPEDTLTSALTTLGVMRPTEEIRADKLLGIEPDYPNEDLQFLDVVHLAFAEDPGGLFVWMESGSEKQRYVDGFAMAIDATGKVVHRIDLGDIYKVPGVNTEALF